MDLAETAVMNLEPKGSTSARDSTLGFFLKKGGFDPFTFGCENMHLCLEQLTPKLHIGATLCSNLHLDPVRSSKLHLPWLK